MTGFLEHGNVHAVVRDRGPDEAEERDARNPQPVVCWVRGRKPGGHVPASGGQHKVSGDEAERAQIVRPGIEALPSNPWKGIAWVSDVTLTSSLALLLP